MIVDAEHLYRENRKLERLLKDARLRIQSASLEDVRASTASGLSKEDLSGFRSERWITEHLNVFLCGATGVGKTHLACALGQFACRRGHRTTYKRLPRLLEELTVVATRAREAGEVGGADHRRLGLNPAQRQSSA